MVFLIILLTWLESYTNKKACQVKTEEPLSENEIFLEFKSKLNISDETNINDFCKQIAKDFDANPYACATFVFLKQIAYKKNLTMSDLIQNQCIDKQLLLKILDLKEPEILCHKYDPLFENYLLVKYNSPAYKIKE